MLAAFVTAVLVGSLAIAAPAHAVTVYELEGEWEPATPEVVQTGDSIAAQWWANVNDDAEAPGNEPVDNVTITVTAVGAVFEEIPPVCLTEGVDPVSSISEDGSTLVCNGGTFNEGTALTLDTPARVTAVEGEPVSMSATIADQEAELPELAVENPFFMDIAWEQNANQRESVDGQRDFKFNWSLFHGAFSADGEDEITYILTVENTAGAPMSVGPEACSAFSAGAATGHPWSGGDHPAEQTAPFVGSCELDHLGGDQFELTLSGIDYSHDQVPTLDSTGNSLPTNRVVVASGEVQIRVTTDESAGSITVVSSAPTYTSTGGSEIDDDPENNTSVQNWTSGFHYGSWRPAFTESGAANWADSYRVSPGTVVQSAVSGTYANVDQTADVGGLCVLLDAQYVTYVDHEVVDMHANDAALDFEVQYYVGSSIFLDPESGSYDPNQSEICAGSTDWVDEAPADLSTVLAVRTGFSAVGLGGRPALRVMQEINSDVQPGQDIWAWSAYRSPFGSANWVYLSRSMEPGDVPAVGVLTPDSRYPYTGQHRDVLRISTVNPVVDKSVSPSTVDPGGSTTYTVDYSAEGTGEISPTVDGYVIEDTLPDGMTYTPGSSVPGPEPEVDGNTLTWTIDGVPTNETQTLSYEVDIAEDVDPGARLVNSVQSSLGSQFSDTSTASVTVNVAGSTSIVKSSDQTFIPNVSGDGVGEGSWTVDVVAEDPMPQEFTDTIDILPYNGDGRGTSMAGTYELSGPVSVSMGATVYYTTADPAALSDDPADPMNGSAGDTAGNTVGWTTDFIAGATAVRVITEELEPRGAFSFTIPVVTDGMDSGDTLVNRAQGRAENTRLVMRTSAPTEIATFYSADLRKYVQDVDGEWRDANDPLTYPEFHIGDTITYRIVVENTGQGTLTNIEVEDDLQPELGSFTIDVLEPGESYTHEFSFVLEEPIGEDDVVNTACAESDIPEDSVDENGDPLPPAIPCDEAGFTPVGDTTHAKDLVSASPIGGGQWEVVYEIIVESVETPAAYYALSDELHFTDQVDIVSAEVSQWPDGVILAEPAWDGQGNLTITDFAEIEGIDNPDYAPHVYEVTVIADVPLQFEGAGDGADDPTVCGGEGDATDRAFTNTSELTKSTDETEEDWACAEIPSIDIAKSITDGPVPNGDGTWTVTYDVVATNSGGAAGDYDISDQMTAGGDLEVFDTAITGSPEGVTPNEDWTGLGAEGAPENVIATDVTLPSGESHTYQVEVLLGMAEGIEGPPNVDECPAEPGADGGGLANTAEIVHNDLTDADNECTSVAAIVIDKSIAGGPVPNGDGTWTITYELAAENIGGAAGDYDLSDRLLYGEGIEILAGSVSAAPEGVEVNEAWTGLGEDGAAENMVAEDVLLEMGELHTYQIEVMVQLDIDTIDPAVLECPEPGSGESGGLANSAELDHNGIVDEDEVCASLPLIDIAKTIAEGPVPNGDGTWTILYELVATNTGGAEGDYDLADQLMYGEGVVVESAAVSGPEGVELEEGWTGLGTEGSAENVIAADVTLEAGAEHVYGVEVTVSLDLETVTPDALDCPEPGSGESGGLANSTELTHNGENRDDDVCAPLPLIDIVKSLAGPTMPVEDEDGVYDVSYELLVTNHGAGAGEYDLTDTLAAGEGIEIIGVQDVSTDAPGAELNDGFDGVDDVVIVTGQAIAGAEEEPVVHLYEVTVRYAADLFGVEVPTDEVCATADGGPVPGALDNQAAVDWNGIVDEDEECIRAGKPTIDKELVSANPIGAGQWEVVYDITVGNVGGEATTYHLDDTLLYAADVTVQEVGVTGPEGVLINEAFDGIEITRIASDVALAGLDDEGYAPHVYTVSVIADVPLQVGPGDEDGTGSPACTEPGGANMLEQGLNNAATLTDENGNETVDTDCAPLPSIAIDKQLTTDPVESEGEWTITYEITATNSGATEGIYTLTDQLRFGDGLEVVSAAVISTPAGVAASEMWTGQGGAGSQANLVAADVALEAAEVHTYQVQVVATLDAAQASENTFSCSAGEEDGPAGFRNVASIGHNDVTADDSACGTPDEPPTPDKPGMPVTGATVGSLAGVAAVLLLLGTAISLDVRRRRTQMSS
ncbi:putative repeat protein (TIGR01451 family) [Bogoriella caseilytica]|uniref:Putative repeat protein (TIGR01451 family) n=2 Tax=Bogoriella caseilytica TaxID=56055 RepID=A0A3N2BEZ8_9MICO|nr:putative repeat protein (TIGR01451 family) [Bogoriella caseilytica]